MAIKVTVPTALKTGFEALSPGEYTGTIKEVRVTKIRSGRHEGIASVDIAVQFEDGRYVWKVLPLFNNKQYNALSEGDKKWVQMSLMSFMKSLGLENEIPDDVVGKEVKVLVGIHQDNGYGPQNSIVKFLK
jgi:hypothetical protein